MSMEDAGDGMTIYKRRESESNQEGESSEYNPGGEYDLESESNESNAGRMWMQMIRRREHPGGGLSSRECRFQQQSLTSCWPRPAGD